MKRDQDNVGTLSDSCFGYATEALTKLCQMFEEEVGEKPQLAELCELLAASLRCCTSDLLRDANVESIAKLTAKVQGSKKIVAKPGDIFLIPRDGGGFYAVIYITSNRFGDAFGIFDGRTPIARIGSNWDPIPTISPIYTGKRFVVSGRWKRVGTRVDLLDLFPSSPEVFHSKTDYETDDTVGSFGCGENAEGEIRDLTEEESNRLDLDGSYRQILLEEQFEDYLAHVLQ